MASNNNRGRSPTAPNRDANNGDDAGANADGGAGPSAPNNGNNEANGERPQQFLPLIDYCPAPYKSREEYMESLRSWLLDAKDWRTGNMLWCPNDEEHRKAAKAAWESICRAYYQRGYDYEKIRLENMHLRDDNDPTVFRQGRPYNLKLAPIWKRLTAEFLDFLLLFLIKTIILYFTTDSNVTFTEYFTLDNFRKITLSQIVMRLVLEYLTIEVIHKVLITFYEIFWLNCYLCATPGKWFMKLIVVQVDSFEPVVEENDDDDDEDTTAANNQNVVTMLKCTNVRCLGYEMAMKRTFLKNAMLGLMLPIGCIFRLLHYNRTLYDKISNAIVVDYGYRKPPTFRVYT